MSPYRAALVCEPTPTRTRMPRWSRLWRRLMCKLGRHRFADLGGQMWLLCICGVEGYLCDCGKEHRRGYLHWNEGGFTPMRHAPDNQWMLRFDRADVEAEPACIRAGMPCPAHRPTVQVSTYDLKMWSDDVWNDTLQAGVVESGTPIPGPGAGRLE